MSLSCPTELVSWTSSCSLFFLGLLVNVGCFYRSLTACLPSCPVLGIEFPLLITVKKSLSPSRTFSLGEVIQDSHLRVIDSYWLVTPGKNWSGEYHRFKTTLYLIMKLIATLPKLGKVDMDRSTWVFNTLFSSDCFVLQLYSSGVIFSPQVQPQLVEKVLQVAQLFGRLCYVA